MQHMIESFEKVGSFNRIYIKGFFNDTNFAYLPIGVGTDFTGIGGGYIIAQRTKKSIFPGSNYGVG
jgi:hypothetical protein